MIEQPNVPGATSARRFPLLALMVLITAIFSCSIYANLSYTITDKNDYAYFPPFKPKINGNWNNHLGAEYINIAKSMYAGKGFSNPFNNLESGPTAWMPPILPTILAGLLWVSDGDRDMVMAVVIFLQVFVLIGTGILVLALVHKTCSRLWTAVAVMLFILGVLCDFHLWFQFTHDCWLVLLALDLLLAGLCWLRPLNRWPVAVSWGVFGGLCALVSPLVALSWGVFSLLLGWHERRWSRLGIALLAAGITLLPWTVRNYLVFGRLIPVKPNLAYELYQSQCLQADGLIQLSTFERHHPNSPSAPRERREYIELGETAYLDHKREQFWDAVWADPQDFLDRVADRFLGATLLYQPLDRKEITKRPWTYLISRVTHPLPFLALFVLVGFAFWKRLHWAQWCAIGVYFIYLSPYIAASYYERYGAPLLAVKVLLVIWAVDHLLLLLPRRRSALSREPIRAELSTVPSKRSAAVPASH